MEYIGNLLPYPSPTHGMCGVQGPAIGAKQLAEDFEWNKIKDMASISSMLDKFNLLSANQLNASVKLLEIWKALNVDNYPLSVDRQEENINGMSTRGDMACRPKEIGKTILIQKTCVSDAIHLWNQSPKIIKESNSVYKAKKEIKAYVKLLPV